jgi:glycerol-3-phosphate acyltransferase PlsX
MVSAGNTGATMASALLRMGRLPGVARPCIATPLPALGGESSVLVDAGANADCQPEWLVQFAQMGAAFYRQRYGVERPKVALLSIGEESSKGNSLTKSVYSLLAEDRSTAANPFEFIGNAEGRDLLAGGIHVFVTDGFTGNVALKTLEGGLRTVMTILLEVFAETPENEAASEVLLPSLLKRAEALDPDNTGGAMLLGLKGVCIISHGSSSARAIVNAVKVGHDLAGHGLSNRLAEAVAAG